MAEAPGMVRARIHVLPRWLGGFLDDARWSLRVARRNPAFTALVIAILAVAIGANTAVFSVVRDVIVKPLPFRDPSRLLAVWDTYLPAFAKVGVSPAEFPSWQNQRDLFEQTAWYRYVPLDGSLSTGASAAVPAHAGFISDRLFPLLGAQPLLGRALRPDEDPHSALISFRLWRGPLGADPAIVGRTLRFNDQPLTVVGVMPPETQFPAWADLWLPPGPAIGDELTNPVRHALGFLARLRPAVSPAQAASRLSAIARRLASEHPKTSTGWGIRAALLQDDLTGDMRPALLLLSGAASLLLLIACANVASLLLARASARAAEIGIRAALGAGLPRIVRQLATESLLLALLAGALGLLLAKLGLLFLLPEHARLDAPVLLFLLALSLAAGVLFGLAPALHILRADPQTLVKSSAAPGAGRSTRSALVVLEFAIALMLVVAGATLARSYAQLMRVNPGFHAPGVLTVRLMAPPSRPPEPLFRRLRQELLPLPGVRAVAASNALPLIADRANTSRFDVPGSPLINRDALPAAQIRAASPGYFDALEIPLLHGRVFTEADLNQPLVIVNQTMARRFWPGRNPVGLRFITGPWGPHPEWATIVGVVGDVKDFGLDSEPSLDIYHPSLAGQYLILKTSGDPLALAGGVERTLHRLDPGIAIASIRSMSGIERESALPRRWTMGLLVAFAVLGLALALAGVYGVMSWSVAQRTREVGIRMALGARRGEILALVLRDGGKLTLAGLALGIPASLALHPILARLVYGVGAGDPLVYLCVPAGLLAASLLACFLPARRASGVDPLVSLRHE